MDSEDKDLYGELLSFIVVYLVDLSERENSHLPTRRSFSPNIKGYYIRYSGLSNWDWTLGLINELEISKMTDSGHSIVLVNGDEIKIQFSVSPKPDVITLDYLLEVFVDLCGSYGNSIKLGTRNHFRIIRGYENLFQKFTEFGYVKELPDGFIWTNKMTNALSQNFI